jgi:hypothetical protein
MTSLSSRNTNQGAKLPQQDPSHDARCQALQDQIAGARLVCTGSCARDATSAWLGRLRLGRMSGRDGKRCDRAVILEGVDAPDEKTACFSGRCAAGDSRRGESMPWGRMGAGISKDSVLPV